MATTAAPANTEIKPAPTPAAAHGSRPEAKNAQDGGPAAPRPDSSSSSLVPLETTPLAALPQTRFQHRVHHRWAPARAAIHAALADSSDHEHHRRAHRLAECCRTAWLGFTEASEASLRAIRCRDRLCPLCGARRARVAAGRTEAIVNQLNDPRFITLTIRSEPVPLVDALDALLLAFRRFRKDPRFRSHISGGVYSIEVTRNAETGLWHPHLHLIADGSYWTQRDLQRCWSDAVGEPSIADIRDVRSRAARAAYVAKYIVKPTTVATWPPSAIREFADALRGRRLFQPFGSAHGVNVDPADPNTDRPPSAAEVYLSPLRAAAQRWPDRAGPILQRASALWPACSPAWDDLTGPPYSQPPPDALDAAEVRRDLEHLVRAWRRATEADDDARLRPPPPAHPPKPGRKKQKQPEHTEALLYADACHATAGRKL